MANSNTNRVIKNNAGLWVHYHRSKGHVHTRCNCDSHTIFIKNRTVALKKFQQSQPFGQWFCKILDTHSTLASLDTIFRLVVGGRMRFIVRYVGRNQVGKFLSRYLFYGSGITTKSWVTYLCPDVPLTMESVFQKRNKSYAYREAKPTGVINQG